MISLEQWLPAQSSSGGLGMKVALIAGKPGCAIVAAVAAAAGEEV